jgi:hypothetical protein
MKNQKLYILLFLVNMIAVNCIAQQVNNKIKFHSINQVGWLQGQSGAASQLQTINGAQYRSWFVGAGVGLDYYRFRTVPLFIDVRKEFGKTMNKFFVYADAGIDHLDVSNAQKKSFNLYPIENEFSRGSYYDVGAGYKFKIKRNAALLFSAGYTYKKIAEKSTIYYGQPDVWYLVNPVFIEQYNYPLSRLTIKVGWQF